MLQGNPMAKRMDQVGCGTTSQSDLESTLVRFGWLRGNFLELLSIRCTIPHEALGHLPGAAGPSPSATWKAAYRWGQVLNGKESSAG